MAPRSIAPFSIFTRKDRKTGKPVFAVKFFDQCGNVLKTNTLREARSRTAAARMAESMLSDGVTHHTVDESLESYLLKFWSRDSDYIVGRALRGIVVSDRYLYGNTRIVKSMLKPYLAGMHLSDVSAKWLERTVISLSKKGYKPRRINAAMQVVKVAYGYHCRLNRLVNQLQVVEKLREKHAVRGVLTAAEVGKLINVDESPQVKAGLLLAALCGLRQGEARGLQVGDVDFDTKTIHITHNFVDEEEGLKGPKWGSVRDVPAPDQVLTALKLCIDTAPRKTPYVLWGRIAADKPVEAKTLRDGFARAMAKIGISPEKVKERNLCYHGLRHSFVSLSRAAGVPSYIVQELAGHTSMDMTDRYSHGTMVDFTAARERLESAIKQAK